MDPYLCSLIDQLEQEHTLSASQWIQLLNGRTPELAAYLFGKITPCTDPVLRAYGLHPWTD